MIGVLVIVAACALWLFVLLGSRRMSDWFDARRRARELARLMREADERGGTRTPIIYCGNEWVRMDGRWYKIDGDNIAAEIEDWPEWRHG